MSVFRFHSHHLREHGATLHHCGKNRLWLYVRDVGHYLAIHHGDGVSTAEEQFGIEAFEALGEKFQAVLLLSQHTGGRDGQE